MAYWCPLYQRLGTGYVPLKDENLPQERQNLHHQHQDSYCHNESYGINQLPVTETWHLSPSPVRGGHSPPIVMHQEIPTRQRGSGNLQTMSRSSEMPPNAPADEGHLLSRPSASTETYFNKFVIPAQEDDQDYNSMFNFGDFSACWSGSYVPDEKRKAPPIYLNSQSKILQNRNNTECRNQPYQWQPISMSEPVRKLKSSGQGHQLSLQEDESRIVGQGCPSPMRNPKLGAQGQLLDEHQFGDNKYIPGMREENNQFSSFEQNISECQSNFDRTSPRPTEIRNTKRMWPKKNWVLRYLSDDQNDPRTNRMLNLEDKDFCNCNLGRGHPSQVQLVSRLCPRSSYPHNNYKHWSEIKNEESFSGFGDEDETSMWIKEHKPSLGHFQFEHETEDLVSFDQDITPSEPKIIPTSPKPKLAPQNIESSLQSQGHQKPKTLTDQQRQVNSVPYQQSQGQMCLINESFITERYEEDDRAVEEYSQNQFLNYMLVQKEDAKDTEPVVDIWEDMEWYLPRNLLQDPGYIDEEEDYLSGTFASHLAISLQDACHSVPPNDLQERTITLIDEEKKPATEFDFDTSHHVSPLVEEIRPPEQMTDDNVHKTEDIISKDHSKEEHEIKVVHFAFKKEYKDPEKYNLQKNYYHIQQNNRKRKCYRCHQRTHFAYDCSLFQTRKLQL